MTSLQYCVTALELGLFWLHAWNRHHVAERVALVLQDRKHVLKVPMKESRRDAAALLHGLKLLESNPEMAEKVADGGRRFVEEVLTVDNVERQAYGPWGHLSSYDKPPGV